MTIAVHENECLSFGHVEGIAAVCFLVKVLFGFWRRVEDVFWRETQDLDDLVHLIHLIGTGKQWLPRVHFHQDAPKGPHVNGKVVGDAKENLWRTVEPGLQKKPFSFQHRSFFTFFVELMAI